jgi:nucleoside-diphosphate-sugar epimerase
MTRYKKKTKDTKDTTEENVPPIQERTLPKRDLKEHPYRLLVTGSEGFIGKYLVNFLRSDVVYQEFVIDTLDIKNGQDIGDFTRPDTRYDCVIHLAAFADIRNSFDDPDRFWENNVEKARGIFKYCEVNNIRLLYASSAGAKEWWLNPYATTKKVNEIMAPHNSVGMRFFNVYQQNFESRQDMLFRMLEDKTATYLTRHKRDWIHIEDVCRAIVRLIPSTITGIVDIGTGIPVSVIELAELFQQGDLPIKEDTPGEPDELCADISGLNPIGWYPTYDIINTVRTHPGYEFNQGNKSEPHVIRPKLETPQQEGKEEET